MRPEPPQTGTALEAFMARAASDAPSSALHALLQAQEAIVAPPGALATFERAHEAIGALVGGALPALAQIQDQAAKVLRSERFTR